MFGLLNVLSCETEEGVKSFYDLATDMVVGMKL